MSHPVAASIKVLAFDVFGTVVDWRSSVIAEGEQLGKTKSVNVDWAAFADAWRAVYRPSLDRVQKGEMPWTKLDVLHRMSLEEILKKFKIEGLSEDEKAHFNRVWHRLKPWPDSVAGLKRLKSRFVITTLSNGNISLLTNMAKHAGLALGLHSVGGKYPSLQTGPGDLRLVPDLFDFKPDEVMLVAAHENDLQSAQKYGLRTAYVHRPFEHGPGKAAAIPASGKYDFVARDFLDLADQMGV